VTEAQISWKEIYACHGLFAALSDVLLLNDVLLLRSQRPGENSGEYMSNYLCYRHNSEEDKVQRISGIDAEGIEQMTVCSLPANCLRTVAVLTRLIHKTMVIASASCVRTD
jgi:ethanolamine ammonia-lyase small subunit